MLATGIPLNTQITLRVRPDPLVARSGFPCLFSMNYVRVNGLFDGAVPICFLLDFALPLDLKLHAFSFFLDGFGYVSGILLAPETFLLLSFLFESALILRFLLESSLSLQFLSLLFGSRSLLIHFLLVRHRDADKAKDEDQNEDALDLPR